MILLTRLNNTEYWVNQDHIQFMERTPETVLSFVDGKKVTVKEAPEMVIERILAFRRLATPPLLEPGSES